MRMFAGSPSSHFNGVSRRATSGHANEPADEASLEAVQRTESSRRGSYGARGQASRWTWVLYRAFLAVVTLIACASIDSTRHSAEIIAPTSMEVTAASSEIWAFALTPSRGERHRTVRSLVVDPDSEKLDCGDEDAPLGDVAVPFSVVSTSNEPGCERPFRGEPQIDTSCFAIRMALPRGPPIG